MCCSDGENDDDDGDDDESDDGNNCDQSERTGIIRMRELSSV